MHYSVVVAMAIIACCLVSCGDKPFTSDDPTVLTDAKMYDSAKKTIGFTWYKKNDALLGKGSHSGHSEPFLRTRYNAIATTVLDASGSIKAGTVFPTGSIIVKELINSDRTTVGTYAMMVRQPTDPNADSKGWVWGYYRGSGDVRTSVSSKGNGCISCHSQSGNIDNTMMNLDHP